MPMAISRRSPSGTWRGSPKRLLDLINPDDSEDAVRQATEAVNGFPAAYERAWLDGLRAKLGLATAEEGDMALGEALLAIMHTAGAGFHPRVPQPVDGGNGRCEQDAGAV